MLTGSWLAPRQSDKVAARRGDDEQPIREPAIVIYGCPQAVPVPIVGHDPAHPRKYPMGSLLSSRSVVGLIEAALAHQHRQALVTPVELNEPAVLEVPHSQHQEQIRTQECPATRPRNLAMAPRFGLTAHNVEKPPASCRRHVDYELGNRQGVLQ